MLQPINKHTVLKQVRELGEWIGYIAPSKVNAGNINEGWHLGMHITIVDGKKSGLPLDKPYMFNKDTEAFTLLEDILTSFSVYNCNNELGNTIRFWEIY